MRFIKNILFDIRNGITKHYMLFLCPLVLTAFLAADCIKNIKAFIEINTGGNVENSFGNVWMYIYGGMEKYVSSVDNPFKFPIVWTTIFVFAALLVLIYPTKDMLGIGTHVVVSGGSRGKWWFSKVIWNMASTLIYHAIIICTLILACLMAGIEIKPGININLLQALCEFESVGDFKMKETLPIAVFFLPIVISVAMNLLQMTLTLFINPNYSFIISCSVMILSAYLMTPFAVYNYAMSLRYSYIYNHGIKYQYGFVVALAIAVISVIIGYFRFLNYDIIKKDDN